jgi:hypothetical protein
MNRKMIGEAIYIRVSDRKYIRKKNDVVPCPKRGDVTHALSEARW